MQLLVVTRSEDMTMRVSDKVRLLGGEEEVRSQEDGRIGEVNVEVTRNCNRGSRYMFMECGVTQNGERL